MINVRIYILLNSAFYSDLSRALLISYYLMHVNIYIYIYSDS